MYVIYLGFLVPILHTLWCRFYVEMLVFFILYEDMMFGSSIIPLQ